MKRLTYKTGKVGYGVTFNPFETRMDIYFRFSATLETFKAEGEHVDCNLPFDKALGNFKQEAEQIYECPDKADELYAIAAKKLQDAYWKCKKCNDDLDRPGGPHGH